MTDKSNEMDGKYLTFWTDCQLYGVPISDVVQIVGTKKITGVPGFPNYAKGIIDLRGSIIPIVDVRLRLNKQEVPYDERTCIIITSIQDHLFGFLVDAVDEVVKIDDENISVPPKMTTDETDSHVNGIAKMEDKVVLLLNIEELIKYEEIADKILKN